MSLEGGSVDMRGIIEGRCHWKDISGDNRYHKRDMSMEGEVESSSENITDRRCQ